MPHGLIPHRLPKEPQREEFEATEAASKEQATDGGGIDVVVDGFAVENDDVDPSSSSSQSEENLGAPSSSASFNPDEGGSVATSGSFERDLTEGGRNGGEEASSIGGAEEEEERAAAAAAASAAVVVGDGDNDNSAPSTSSSSSTEQEAKPSPPPSPPPPPRPSWPPPRRPKKNYAQLQLPSPEQMAQEETMNNCGVRTVLSGVMGAGLGVVFGIFMGTMDMAGPQPGAAGPLPPAAVPPAVVSAPPAPAAPTGTAAGTTTTAGATAPTPPPPPLPPKQSIREVLRQTVISTRQRCASYAKGFGAMGALFAGSECVIEKARAKHDIYNAVYAGCAAGGALAASGGVKAAGVGCVSFAAFSAFIEKVMQHD